VYAVIWSATYVVPGIFSWITRKTEHECPNCRSKFIVEPPRVQQTTNDGANYSLLRGEDYLDEDATAYTDGRTSEEQIGVDAVADVEETKGAGPIKL
jgi:hypothetical protein